MMFRSCFQHLGGIERRRIVTAPNVSMRLNRGERPHPLPHEVQLSISLALGLGTIQQYPSYQQFYSRLSKHVGVPTNQIVVGAGIEEFIRTLMFLSCDPGQKAAVLWPTCAMYDIYASAFGVDLVRIKPRPGEPFSAEDVLDTLPGDTRILFLPNPGQPVETHFNLDELRLLAEICEGRGTILAVDEAHFGFGAATALPLVENYENVLVMRTFSKFFGAASIRVGYVVGQPTLIKSIDAARPSGEIAGPSMIIATVLLDNFNVMVEEAIEIANARDWLRDEINTYGYQAWGNRGFSILIELDSKEEAVAVAAKLAEGGIYVKADFPPPVERCMLLACGKLPLMRRFLEEFKLVVVRQFQESCLGGG